MKWGVMILAAGEASRIGKAKMLLPYKQTTILGHLIKEISSLDPSIIQLVTGHYHDLIVKQVNSDSISIIQNKGYKNGMSSSIQVGLTAMLNSCSGMDFLVIVVSDQPFLSSSVLISLFNKQQQTAKGIVASTYNGIRGTPVLFRSSYFTHLYNLAGDKGARGILQQFPDDVATIDFESGELDIDTVEDYERFCKIINEDHVD
ncbi:nucleotidyltransferase family protein [Sediminibacterium sp.]|uniref:nucleotidyltransferase family protein n=1 Tax=Sediminibacterium sp. TaxID=1917865 RepID=UPI003F70951E